MSLRLILFVILFAMCDSIFSNSRRFTTTCAIFISSSTAPGSEPSDLVRVGANTTAILSMVILFTAEFAASSTRKLLTYNHSNTQNNISPQYVVQRTPVRERHFIDDFFDGIQVVLAAINLLFVTYFIRRLIQKHLNNVNELREGVKRYNRYRQLPQERLKYLSGITTLSSIV